jgi:hypothetical protein
MADEFFLPTALPGRKAARTPRHDQPSPVPSMPGTPATPALARPAPGTPHDWSRLELDCVGCVVLFAAGVRWG